MIDYLNNPLSLAYLPSLPIIEYESPLVFPSLSKLESLPVKKLTFHFPSHILKNRRILESCTTTLRRIDNHLSELNSMDVLYNIKQATKLTYKNCETPTTWIHIVEKYFHSHIMKNGLCPRDLYADYIEIIEKWLLNLAEVLENDHCIRRSYTTKTSLILKEIEINGK